jgi:hypothetical protein
MMPTLHPGWTVGVRAISPANLRTGDVAVFLSGTEFVAHRIVLSLGWGRRRILVEQGDALSAGSRLDPDTLMGRVERVLDHEGRVVERDLWEWGAGPRMVKPPSVFVRLALKRILRGFRSVCSTEPGGQGRRPRREQHD